MEEEGEICYVCLDPVSDSEEKESKELLLSVVCNHPIHEQCRKQLHMYGHDQCGICGTSYLLIPNEILCQRQVRFRTRSFLRYLEFILIGLRILVLYLIVRSIYIMM